jgi:hypothetical protein
MPELQGLKPNCNAFLGSELPIGIGTGAAATHKNRADDSARVLR